MIEENRQSKAEMRELTMLRLLKGGASIEDVIEIVKKLYIADQEDWDEEFVQREVLGYHELHLSDGTQSKRNVQAEVENWLLSYTSNSQCNGDVTCSLLSCYLENEYKTIQEKTACRVAFRRLVERGKLESLRNRSGMYRILNGHEEPIDFINANIAPFDIRLPLAVHEWVTIHRGNVIIIAGESNAGKTAFCLNVAKLNRDSAKVNYMSSEMNDGAELRIRLDEFGGDIEFWKGIKFTFRTDDFPRHIDPDGLNIIDYLDEGTDSEAYKMPMRIRLISDRLKKGVAVIAIQKDPNKGLGFGGSGTLNRARLYITLSRAGILKIEKGKIWRQKTINPNGMFCDFKLAAGCHFKKEGDWKT